MNSLLAPEAFLLPWREEVEEVMMSGAAAMGEPEGRHMLCRGSEVAGWRGMAWQGMDWYYCGIVVSSYGMKVT